MKDIVYYRDLINQMLLEQPTDDVPELPDDEELDKIKLNTMIKLSKLPKWWQGFSVYKDVIFGEITGTWEVEGYWPVTYKNFITLLDVRPINIMYPDETTSFIVARLKYPIDKTKLEANPKSTADIEHTLNDILKDFGFKSPAKFHSGHRDVDHYVYSFTTDIGYEIAEFYKKNFLKDNTQYHDIEKGIIREADDDIPELPSDDELDKIKFNTMIKLGKAPNWINLFNTNGNEIEATISGQGIIEFIRIVLPADPYDFRTAAIYVKFHDRYLPDVREYDFDNDLYLCGKLLSETFVTDISDIRVEDPYYSEDYIQVSSRTLNQLLRTWIHNVFK